MAQLRTLASTSRRCVAVVLLVAVIHCHSSGASVCDKVGARYRTGIQVLLNTVLSYDKLNLILLLDVSGSIGKTLYRKEVEKFAVELVEYGIRKSGMKVHPDHAHVELLTFDDLANIQGYTGESVHACGIYTRLQQLDPGRFKGRTEIHNAFNSSRQLFRKRQRPGDKKVLFVVTDVGFTSSPAALRTSVGRLHALGVEIFTIGVGQLSSSWIQTHLDTIVVDELHFLCYSTWSELVKWTTPKEYEGLTFPEITWAAVTASQQENSCPACVQYSSCKCAVREQRYMCPCDNGRYLSSQNTCEECPGDDGCPETESNCPGSCQAVENIIKNDDNPTIPQLTLIIVISAIALALLLVLLVILLVLVRWRRYRGTSTAPSGVQAFINFISLKKVINMNTVVINDKKVPMRNDYVIDASRPSSMEVTTSRASSTEVVSEASNPRTDPIPNVQELVQAYETRRQSSNTSTDPKQLDRSSRSNSISHTYSDCVRHSTCSSHQYTPIIKQTSQVDDEGYQIPVTYSSTLDTHADNTYENTTNRATECLERLSKLVDTTDIDGAALFCKQDESLVTVGNLHVRACDVTHVLRLLGCDTQQGSVVPVDGRIYDVRIHHPCNSLYAEESPGGKDKSAIWVINTENHLILTKGIRAMALNCEQYTARFALDLEG